MNANLKEKLTLRRLDCVYCRLCPSTVHGIGIFAIKQIPKGVNPFKHSYMAQESILLSKSKITNKEILNMLHDYHPTADDKYQIVSDFPNQLIWTNYLNYSDNPNIELMTNGEWETLRQIEIGEELFEDPKRLYDSEGNQKIFKVVNNQYPSIKY